MDLEDTMASGTWIFPVLLTGNVAEAVPDHASISGGSALSLYTGDESQGEQDKATEGEQSGQNEEEEEGKRKEGDEKNVIGCEMHGSILVSFTDSTPLWDIWTTVLKA